jgi:hypothetical protein
VGKGRLSQAGWPVKQQMVKCLAPAFRRFYGNVQVVLDLILPDELIQMAWPETDVKRGIFNVGFT